MISIGRRLFCVALVLAIGAGFSLGAAVADEPIVWRYQTTLVETRQEMAVVRDWAERIKDRSAGRLKVEIYYGGALGIGQSDELRAIRQGAVEVAAPYFGYLARDMPELALAVPQGIFLNPDEVVGVTDILKEIFRENYEKWNAKVIGWQMSPVFDMSILCKEPVNTLEMFKGKKLRVWSRDQVEAYNELGVAAQIIPQNDTYVALQTGVVDCAIYVLGNAKTVSFQEVTDFSAQLHTYSGTPNPIVVNTDVWNELPDDLKAVVMEAGEWLWQTSLGSAKEGPAKKEQAAKEEFAASGELKVLAPFPAADKSAFYDAVLGIWKVRAEERGGKAVEYRKRVIKALADFRRG